MNPWVIFSERHKNYFLQYKFLVLNKYLCIYVYVYELHMNCEFVWIVYRSQLHTLDLRNYHFKIAFYCLYLGLESSMLGISFRLNSFGKFKCFTQFWERGKGKKLSVSSHLKKEKRKSLYNSSLNREHYLFMLWRKDAPFCKGVNFLDKNTVFIATIRLKK